MVWKFKCATLSGELLAKCNAGCLLAMQMTGIGIYNFIELVVRIQDKIFKIVDNKDQL